MNINKSSPVKRKAFFNIKKKNCFEELSSSTLILHSQVFAYFWGLSSWLHCNQQWDPGS